MLWTEDQISLLLHTGFSSKYHRMVCAGVCTHSRLNNKSLMLLILHSNVKISSNDKGDKDTDT